MKLWEKRKEINIEQLEKYYLYKAVYHRCLNSIRDKKVKEANMQQYAYSIKNNTGSLMEGKETAIRINNAVNKLPPKCMEIFIKSRFEGKRYSEIANELKISVKTVEAQMSKALKNLRILLSDLIKK